VLPAIRPQVLTVYANRPGERAGLQYGDVLLGMDGHRGLDRQGLVDHIQKKGPEPIEVEIERNGAVQTVTVTPEGSVGDAKIGVIISSYEVMHVDPSIPQAFKMSLKQNWDSTFQIAGNLKGLFTGETKVKQLMGPVAIAELSGNASKLGPLELLGLMAMISLNLALLNLMPVPVLDGGQIAILAIEGLFRRNLSVKLKEGFAIAGALMIVALMVTVLYNDIARLVR